MVQNKKTPLYFQAANSWSDDIYTSTLVSRNRYRIAFLTAMLLCMLLTISVLILAPMQHTQLVIMHEGPSGDTWLSTTEPGKEIPINWQRTQAEIAHYIRMRESYDPLLYAYLAHEVKSLSNAEITNEYEKTQANRNALAPINTLGNKGYRTVIIHNVLPLDTDTKNKTPTDKHVNLAQVNYEIVDHFFNDSRTIKKPYTALISWQYRGTPNGPNQQLMNWDGFTVTKFLAEPVNTDES